MRTPSVAVSRIVVIGGFEFPAGPGPLRVRDCTEKKRWGLIVDHLSAVRGLLASSDRGFYRDLIGLESMARANLRDRSESPASSLDEPMIPGIDAPGGR